jgi:Carboxypeptidase regulatory-like domain
VKARAPVILFTLLASFLIPILIGNVYATSGCTTGCQVTVGSNVLSSDGTIWVTIYNGTGPGCSSNPCTVSVSQSSPPTFMFVNNTIASITVLNSSFTGASTQGHYAWKYWANYYGTANPRVWTTSPTLRIPPAGSSNGILFNYTSTAGFTAVFDKQFQYTLSFNDASGNPLSPAPTSVVLSAQTGGPVNITQFSGFLNSNVYTVSQAMWEGSALGTTSPAQIDLTTGSATKAVLLQAYPASVHVVDNNNNPISGANVTVSFINSTSRSFLTNSKGNVQLGDVPRGSYSLSVVYQNQQVTGLIENAMTNPTATVQMNVGSTAPSTTTSAIVLLTIFGLAFFLILLAIKVRKPPPPPTI